MNCLTIITCSRKATTVADHLAITRRRVRSATWEVGQQSSWFQQQHSVRTAGPPSTPDIWSPTISLPLDTAPAIFVWTRHQKSQLVEHHWTKQWSTLLRSSVVRYHVQSIPLGESWPVSFALSDTFHKHFTLGLILYPLLCASNRIWTHVSLFFLPRDATQGVVMPQ